MTRNPGAGFPAPTPTPWDVAEIQLDMYGKDFEPVIACVWWGDKYDATYLRRLRISCERHMRIPFRFVCLTDREDVQDEDIEFLQTPMSWPGWWQKIYLFNRELWEPNERVLMLDLDLVITGDLTDFFYSDHHTTAVANFGPNWTHSKYNSSIVCWDAHGPAGDVYDAFMDRGPGDVIAALHGDQCWFWRVLVDDVRVWPEGWVVSYKYDVRGKTLLPKGCRAVVFHGKPDPHEVRDGFVLVNWHDL